MTKIILSALLLFVLNGLNAQCSFTGFDFTTNDPLAHCSGSTAISIQGTVLINSYWDMSAYAANIVEINAGQVLFDADFTWNLPLNATLILTNNGGVAYSGGRNVNKAIAFGGTVVATANGGGGTFTFAEVIAAGGMNAQGPLPVDLIRFEVEKDGPMVLVEWETAQEFNNEAFSLEHSTDGKHFNPIAKLQGAGTSLDRQLYQYQHSGPKKGMNYYRLLQKDFDGQFKYSQVKSIRFVIKDAWRLVNTVASDLLKVEINDQTSKEINFSIFNLAGQKIQEQILSGSTSINVAHLPMGTYLLRAFDGKAISTKRFIKK